MHRAPHLLALLLVPSFVAFAGAAPHTPSPVSGASSQPENVSLSWHFAPGDEGVVMYAAAKASGGSGGPGPSDLYRVDLQSGAFTLIGPIGFNGVNGMSFGADGVLYAAAAGEDPPGTNPRRADLIRIDPATGAGTFLSVIGVAGNPDSVSRAVDLATSPSGTIYGVGYRNGGTVLFTINPGSGVVNVIGPVDGDLFLTSIDFALDGVLHGIVGDVAILNRYRFATVDPMTGARTPTHQINALTQDNWVNAGDFPAGGGNFYFSVRSYNPDGWRLMRADPATGVVTLDVAAPIGLDGLASTSAVTYDVYLDTNNPPTTLICDDATAPACETGELERCTTHYWRVVADVNGTMVEGPVWSFTTGFFSAADVDGDGDVDFTDLNILLFEYGGGPDCPAP